MEESNIHGIIEQWCNDSMIQWFNDVILYFSLKTSLFVRQLMFRAVLITNTILNIIFCNCYQFIT